MLRTASLFAAASALLLALAPASFGQAGDGHSEGHGHHGKAERGDDGHGDHGHGDLHAPGHHHDFSDVERWSAIFDAPERDAWQRPRRVVELMGVTAGMTVADLGAGTGYFLPFLAEAVGKNGRVLGLDVEQSLVDHMNGRAKSAGLDYVEARLVPRDGLGLEAGTLDRLLVVNTWHHLDDRPNYARHIGEVLTRDGVLVIVDYTLEAEQGPPKKHRLSAQRVIAELEAGGLVAEVMEEDLPRQYVVLARVPSEP